MNVAEAAMNSLADWKERDKANALNYIEDLEKACQKLKDKFLKGVEMHESDVESIGVYSEKVRDYFLKINVASKAIRMINYHVEEAKKIQAVPR